MPDRTLPDHPNLEQYKKQAKELRRSVLAGTPVAIELIRQHHPRLGQAGLDSLRALSLADAQLVLAREHGYESWSEFAKHIGTLRVIRVLGELRNPVDTFLEVACVDRHGWHGSGTLEHAEMIRSRYPEVSTANIYCASVLGAATTVRAFLARDRSLAMAKGGPHEWDALTYLCFSRYLRIDKARSESLVASARALLENGANANTGWTEYIDTPPRPLHEAAIYGAAGVARHAELTRLLLKYGADPNDEETPYHVAETYDNTVLQVLLESGRFNETSLATVAARKCDWHDNKGLDLVLDRGVNPNYRTIWKITPFQQSIRRDNGLVMIEALLDHGADPRLSNELDGRNAFQMAAWYGRGDILATLERRGFEIRFEGLDSLVAACARGNLEGTRLLASGNPELRTQVLAMGGTLLAHFSGANNDAGVRCLLAVGVSSEALWPNGDGYWELAPGSTALHVAAWRANHEVVKTLIAAGAPVNASDGRGRTPLQLAVRACIDSYWKYRRKPDSVAALLSAGAITNGIDLPTGYSAIDDLLVAQGKENPGLNR
jgi:ankyrin repeat protein